MHGPWDFAWHDLLLFFCLDLQAAVWPRYFVCKLRIAGRLGSSWDFWRSCCSASKPLVQAWLMMESVVLSLTSIPKSLAVSGRLFLLMYYCTYKVYIYTISSERLCLFVLVNGPTDDFNLASHRTCMYDIVNTYSEILSVPIRLVIGSSSRTFSQVSIQEALKRTWTLKRTDLSTLIEVLTMASWMEASRNRVKLYACSTLR